MAFCHRYTVAVKYCGGDDDRFSIAERLRREEGLALVRWRENPLPPYCLLFRRSDTRSGRPPESFSTVRTILVEPDTRYDEVKEKLVRLFAGS